MTADPEVLGEMTEAEARTVTTEIRGHLEAAWLGLLEIHQRRGYVALGYETFGGYLASELGVSRSRGYQLLDKAKVTKAITAAAGVDVSNALDITARGVAAVKPKLTTATDDITARVDAGEDPDVVIAEVIDAVTVEPVPAPAPQQRPTPSAAVGDGDTVAERYRKRHGISRRRKIDPVAEFRIAVSGESHPWVEGGVIACELIGFDDDEADNGHQPWIGRAELVDIAELEPAVLVEALDDLDRMARAVRTLRKAIVRAQAEAAERGGQP